MSAYGSTPSHFKETCTSLLASGNFSQITVLVTQHEIRQTNFIMRGTALRIGDLIVLWGMPEVKITPYAIHLYWHGRGIHASTLFIPGRYLFFRAVQRITFADLRSL
jgi:hypothetical protein